jgi:hypothetical protein
MLGVAVLLLGTPLSAAAENDDLQTPSLCELAALPSDSASARLKVSAQVLSQFTILARPVASHRLAADVSEFVFTDCRSNLRALCLLRC